MFTHFSWKAVVGILLASAFSSAFSAANSRWLCDPPLQNAAERCGEDRADPAPSWITAVKNLGFLGSTEFSERYLVHFVDGLLFIPRVHH